jgi:hypothetical protein
MERWTGEDSQRPAGGRPDEDASVCGGGGRHGAGRDAAASRPSRHGARVGESVGGGRAASRASRPTRPAPGAGDSAASACLSAAPAGSTPPLTPLPPTPPPPARRKPAAAITELMILQFTSNLI